MNALFPRLLSVLTAFVVSGSVLSRSAEAADFKTDIRPLLEKHCFECHGEKKQKGGLRLDRRADLLKGGDSAKAPFVPGKSAESEMIIRLTSSDPDEQMPPKGERMPATAIAKLKAWIDADAAIPDDGSSTGAEHWAYQKPKRRTLPEVQNAGWCRNGIDRWVLARLESAGLVPSPEASKATLLRRVSLDLTGLPPTIEEVDGFLADSSPAAYEKVVERLLNSPAYGERWARPWLDLARYADTQGYEKDNRRSMWPWRDWVIDALNRDLPFDQFTIEQIAGDLLPSATQEQKVATGFHRNTMTNTEGGTDNEEFRYEALVDRVNTTFGTWMGTTMACAQCHNHKYDPFLNKEYFQVLAFLNHTADADHDDESPTMKVFAPGQKEQLDTLRAAQSAAEKALSEAIAAPGFAEEMAKWEATVQPVPWTVLQPSQAKSDGEVQLEKRENGALLASGTNPANATYTITTTARQQAITGFRIDALLDDSLPRKGPGRSVDGNVILTEFKVTANGAPVKLINALADFQQEGWPVAHTLDGNPETGWAWGPQFGRAHHAIFAAVQPIESGSGGETQLTVILEHGNSKWPQHVLGKFRISATTARLDVAPLPNDVAAIIAVPVPQRDAKQKTRLIEHYQAVAPTIKPLAEAAGAAKKAADDFYKALPDTSVMVELPKPRVTRRHVRGAYLSPAEEVEPATPAVLHPFPTDAPRNRLGFAKWIVDRENPLTARVIVNRFWEQYFGRGLVETVEEFGRQGDLPSHPELLDWLAVEFMEGARSMADEKARPWSMKALHRLMVMSATYRQSSRVTPELRERDPANRLLARGARVRLEAEMIRDQALALAGLLSRKIGGPSVFPPQPDGLWQIVYNGEGWKTSPGEDRYRRGLYTFWRRSMPHPMMTNFDAPSREFCVLRRNRSDTPLQALNTLNDPAFVEAAQALARKITGAEGDAKARAIYAFRTCLARSPSEAEIERVRGLYKSEYAAYCANPGEAAKMCGSERGGANSDENIAELAAWTVVANVLLNLDETITKG